jgi:vacuolar protein sorting-associated protein 13A/C
LSIFLSSTLGLNLLFHDVANGARDVFYKPIEGFVEGPLEGGRGLAIGAASLVRNTLGGFISLTSRLSNKFSSGFVLLAADDDFIEKREEAKSNKAKTEI